MFLLGRGRIWLMGGLVDSVPGGGARMDMAFEVGTVTVGA